MTSATARETPPATFSFLTMSMAVAASMMPTPAIMPLAMSAPMKSTILVSIPQQPMMVMMTAPKNTMVQHSERFLPAVPA